MEDLKQVNKAEDEKEEVPVGEHEDGTQVSISCNELVDSS